MLEEQSGPLPTLGSFSEEGKPLRLIQRSLAKDDPEPKAISCYGLHLPEIGDTWLRFVDGRPVSSITTRFLEWSLEKLEGIAWRSSKGSVRRSWSSSGTTRAGTSPRRSGAGSVLTTAESRRADAE
jgi:hypothetical protein